MKRLFIKFLKERKQTLEMLAFTNPSYLSIAFADWRNKQEYHGGGDKVNKFQIRKWIEKAQPK